MGLSEYLYFAFSARPANEIGKIAVWRHSFGPAYYRDKLRSMVFYGENSWSIFLHSSDVACLFIIVMSAMKVQAEEVLS